MRGTQAKFLRRSVYAITSKIRHPFPKLVLRKVKKAFNETPRNRRENFDPRTGLAS